MANTASGLCCFLRFLRLPSENECGVGCLDLPQTIVDRTKWCNLRCVSNSSSIFITKWPYLGVWEEGTDNWNIVRALENIAEANLFRKSYSPFLNRPKMCRPAAKDRPF